MPAKKEPVRTNIGAGGREWAEQALRESEEKYRLLSENTTDTVWIMDMDLRVTYSSPSVAKLRGFTDLELKEMPLEKHMTPDSFKLASAMLLEELPRLKADPGYNPVRTAEIEYVCKDGTTFLSEVKLSAIRDKSGRLISIMGRGRDVTERRKIEAALRESEGKFRNIVEHITDIFFMLNANREMLYVSPQCEQLLGYTVEEVRSNWQNYLTDNPLNAAGYELTQLALTTGKKQKPYLQEFMHRDGTKRLIEINESPLKNDKGEVIGVVGAARDMTEHKRILELMRESEEKYRSLVDNAMEVIAVAMDGKFIFANRRMTELTGYSQEEITTRPFTDFVHPDDRQAAAERYLQRIKGEAIPNVWSFRGVNKAGGMRWVEVSVAPITWEGMPATLNFMTDITDRKRLEEEQQRVEKLESVGRLAGGIAHDFNNILTAILGNINLARLEAQPGSEINEILEQAEKASLRAKDLTVQLLTFSKGGAPVKKLTSLAELVKDTVRFALSGSNVKCHFSIPDELWHAEIDAGQVSQVIRNLVLNALQAMPGGGAIELSAENMAISETKSLGSVLPVRAGNYISIAVTDHGIGIPPEHLEKIFDPFFTTRQKSSGMGLATSFSIARQHGGHLGVKSETGSGSTFYLYLPASHPQMINKEAIKVAGKARILVMDDERAVREVAGRMLKHIGYADVEFAVDGAEAIKLYQAAIESGKPFTLSILDLTVAGGMGGEAAIRKLLKIDPGIKAIVSSGYVDDPVMAKYDKYGFIGVVAKPYTIHELSKAVQDVIG
jgi:PAS domain S-box-containing protein